METRASTGGALPNLDSVVIDSMLAQTAVLDADGVIIRVNQAWVAFARENGREVVDDVGRPYLAACVGDGDEAAAGIADVLAGRLAYNLEKLLKEEPGELLACAEDALRLKVTLLHREPVAPNLLLQHIVYEKRTCAWNNSLTILGPQGTPLRFYNLDKQSYMWRRFLLRPGLPFRIVIQPATVCARISLRSTSS